MSSSSLVPPPSKLERYFFTHMFSVKHLLSMSDAEPMLMSDLLEKADDECKELWKNLKLE